MEDNTRFDECQEFSEFVQVSNVSGVVGYPFTAIQIGVATDHRHWPASRILQQSVDNVKSDEPTPVNDQCGTKSS